MDRNAFIYPGHPVAVALCIIRTFRSWEDAIAKPNGADYCNALTSQDVPGAGGNVYLGLDLIRHVREGHLSFEDAIALADRQWHDCDGQGIGGYGKTPEEKDRYVKRWLEGQEQANAMKAALKTELASWGSM